MDVTVAWPPAGSPLKKIALIPVLACAFVAPTAPLAMVALSTAGWGIRVNHGTPVAESYFGEVEFRSTVE